MTDIFRLQTVLSAKKSLPIAVEMESRFGEADHFITHYGFPSQKTNTWNTEVFFGGRYVLTMQVKVAIDYGHRSFTQVEKPVFYLKEVTKVTLTRIEGVDEPGVSGDNGFSTRFSEVEWKTLYESHGDFSEIGIELNVEICTFIQLSLKNRSNRGDRPQFGGDNDRTIDICL